MARCLTPFPLIRIRHWSWLELHASPSCTPTLAIMYRSLFLCYLNNYTKILVLLWTKQTNDCKVVHCLSERRRCQPIASQLLSASVLLVLLGCVFARSHNTLRPFTCQNQQVEDTSALHVDSVMQLCAPKGTLPVWFCTAGSAPQDVERNFNATSILPADAA